MLDSLSNKAFVRPPASPFRAEVDADVALGRDSGPRFPERAGVGSGRRRILSMLAILIVVAGASSACSRHYAGIYREGISENQQALIRLRIGMTATEVTEAMGQGEIVQYGRLHLVDPWRTESFVLNDGTTVLILFYVTQPPRRYSQPEDKNLTPIVLEGGAVVGWGWAYLRQNFDRYNIETPKDY